MNYHTFLANTNKKSLPIKGRILLCSKIFFDDPIHLTLHHFVKFSTHEKISLKKSLPVRREILLCYQIHFFKCSYPIHQSDILPILLLIRTFRIVSPEKYRNDLPSDKYERSSVRAYTCKRCAKNRCIYFHLCVSFFKIIFYTVINQMYQLEY